MSPHTTYQYTVDIVYCIYRHLHSICPTTKWYILGELYNFYKYCNLLPDQKSKKERSASFITQILAICNKNSKPTFEFFYQMLVGV